MKNFFWCHATRIGLLSLALTGCAATPTQESTGQYFDDSAITLKVKTALLNAGVTTFARVSVSTHKGVVDLSGSVSTGQAAELAGTTAQGISGVKQVDNNIKVNLSE